jgi:adenylate cyclase
LAKAGFAISGSLPTDVIADFNGAIVSLPKIDMATSGSGFVDIAPGTDGIVRSAPLLSRIGDQTIPSLALEALRVAQGAGAIEIKSTNGSGQISGGEEGVVAIKVGQFEIPTTRDGQLWMYYRKPRPRESTPAWKILTGALTDPEMKAIFDGCIVFIGTGAVGLHDLVTTPSNDKELGVVVHAQAAEQIIQGKYLVRPDWSDGLEVGLILLFGVGISLLLPGLGALRGGVVAAAALAASIGGSWVAFRYQSFLVDPTYPVLGTISVYVAETLVNFYREERARAYIHRAFDRYLAPELVRRIASDPSQLNLGGEERDMTVLFCDIRGFSRISERLSPPDLISFLIVFLTPMSDILMRHKATIDKYIGDAILAFWNAPLDDPDHAANAARAALEMVERLKVLNAASGPHWPGEIRIGVGLDSGLCCVGNIGSTQRLNYSLIGDTVNLASRLEGMTKVYGIAIAAGHEFAQRLANFAIVEIDTVRVVGRDTPEPVFALVGVPEVALELPYRQMKDSLGALLSAYRKQDWNGAEAALGAFKSTAGQFGLDKLATLYGHRIETFRKAPPPESWDGVFEATEK